MVSMSAQKLFSIVCNKHSSKNLNRPTLHNLRITNPLKASLDLAFTNFQILQLMENVGPPNSLLSMLVLFNEEQKRVKIEDLIKVNVFFSFSGNKFLA